MAADYRIDLLKELAIENQWVSPSISKASKFGYSYQLAKTIFQCADGEELEALEFLARNQYLDRQFFDKVHVCPHCSHYQLNFREICPSCNSSHIQLTKQLHHYACGYVAPEHEFRAGLDYSCPKCHTILRHIGVDYGEPSEAFLCNQCNSIFADAEISCHCLNCSNLFDVNAAIKQTLYSYKLNAKGIIAIEQEEIKELSQNFIEEDFPVYNKILFKEFLNHHFNDSRRYGQPLVLLRIQIENLDNFMETKGAKDGHNFLRNLILLFRQSLRDTDILGLLDNKDLGVLMPDTPATTIDIILDKLCKTSDKLKLDQSPTEEPIALTFSYISYSSELETPVQMFELIDQQQRTYLLGSDIETVKTKG